MKLMLFLTVLVSSFSVFAKEQMLSDLLREKRCQIEVSQDVVVQYSKDSATAGQTLLVMKEIDNSNNRRLKVGRVLKISHADENYIVFNDKHVESLCIYQNNLCHELNRVKAADFEAWSQKKLKLICNVKPTIDI
ncbi:hypothetical protein ACJVC5_08980 [Peredibacter sp. HCB2-198]|uniref:hypothetical protein n=1 Tax=Peredibacter sp. HCB2-198 TaxID=3383025 RepID=UPI0038B54AC2